MTHPTDRAITSWRDVSVGDTVRLMDGRVVLVGDVNVLGGLCDDCREVNPVAILATALPACATGDDAAHGEGLMARVENHLRWQVGLPPAPSLPAAPAPTRPRVSTAGSGQEARLVVTPAAPAHDAVREARATAREVVARLLAWANERTASKNGAIRQDGFAVKNALRSIIDPADLLAAERAQRDAGAAGDQRAQDAKGGE